jgi:ligand-binding SRPBCC domain-containing protein
MQRIILETQINAPAAVCFDLMRDVRLHKQTTAHTNGAVGLGQTATFEGTHFGMRQRLTVEVTAFERPHLFVDEMIEGNFSSFKHIHEFTDTAGVTLMRDTVDWTSPFGILGRIVDKLFLKPHLTKLISTRNAKLKEIAERSSN